MKHTNKLILAGLASAILSTASFGDGLLGKRYIGLSIGSDFDFDDAAYGVEFNTNISKGIDFGAELSSSDDGDVQAGSIDITFFRDITGSGETFAYISPAIGYIDTDYPSIFTDSNSAVYGLAAGIEQKIDDATNANFSVSYYDTEEFGDLGVTVGAELNRWFSETFNAGVELSYNFEVEDEALTLFGRFAF